MMNNGTVDKSCAMNTRDIRLAFITQDALCCLGKTARRAFKNLKSPVDCQSRLLIIQDLLNSPDLYSGGLGSKNRCLDVKFTKKINPR